jgi:hypothetical protein
MLFKRKVVDHGPEIHAINVQIKQLQEDLLALQSNHERLRGRFYASKGSDSAPPMQTKGDILRAFGYAPGRPIPKPSEG